MPIPIHIGGGDRGLGPWTILARKDQNTLIEQSVTLIEQLLFRSCFSNIVKVSKWYLKCDDFPGASPQTP